MQNPDSRKKWLKNFRANVIRRSQSDNPQSESLPASFDGERQSSSKLKTTSNNNKRQDLLSTTAKKAKQKSLSQQASQSKKQDLGATRKSSVKTAKPLNTSKKSVPSVIKNTSHQTPATYESSNSKFIYAAMGFAAALILVLAIALISWPDGEDQPDNTAQDNTADNNANTNDDTTAPRPTLSVASLDPLSQGSYQAWVVKDGQNISIGQFNTDSNGDVVGGINTADVSPKDGDQVLITIESGSGGASNPSDTVVLSGVISGGVANLSFPFDISSFRGGYILKTPTDGSATNETSGVWFEDNRTSPHSASLIIPDAPAGWAYEGWVVVDGKPLSTGQFLSPVRSDESDRYSSTAQSSPDFPGEDFLQNLGDGLTAPLNLTDGSSEVVVSLEPRIDGVDPTGPEPFQVKPLSATIANGAGSNVVYSMQLNTDTPSASISFQ